MRKRDEVRRLALELAGVLDQHDAIGCLGDFGEQRVDERGLAGRCAARDQDVAALRRPRRGEPPPVPLS